MKPNITFLRKVKMQPARALTVKRISDELDVLEARLRDMHDNPDFDGHCGSPGEWMVERMDDLETELKRRHPAVS